MDISTTINNYLSKGILLDSNLLLLYFIGKYDKYLIPKFKRTNTFTIKDYEYINFIVQDSRKIVTTPHILTEVSNLSNSLPSYSKKEFYNSFFRNLEILDEKYVPAIEIAQDDRSLKFGLTDAVIKEISTNDFLVLTTDASLSNYLSSIKIEAINYNHIRDKIYSL